MSGFQNSPSYSINFKAFTLYIFSIIFLFWFAPANVLAKENLCIQGNCSNGQGTLTFYFGARYKGEFRNGKMHGSGHYFWPEGDGNLLSYKGSFKKGSIEGHGTLNYKDGRTFTGNFSKSKRHGKGQIHWPDGRVFEGQWKEGKDLAFGVLSWRDGSLYLGEWNGERDGAGIFKSSDGTLYKGRWKGDKMHGEGILSPLKGQGYKGKWVNGELVEKYNLVPEDVREGQASINNLYTAFLWERVRQCVIKENPEIHTEYGIVTSKALNMRSRPFFAKNILRKLQKNESVIVLSKRNSWLKVVDLSCNVGWVKDLYLDIQVTSPRLLPEGETIFHHHDMLQKGIVLTPIASDTSAFPQGKAPFKNAQKAPLASKSVMKLQQMKVSGGRGHVKIALFANKPIEKHHFFILRKSHRVVLDLAGKWEMPSNEVKSAFSKNSLVKKIRMGKNRNRLRIVSDLYSANDVDVKIKADGRELVLIISQE